MTFLFKLDMTFYKIQKIPCIYQIFAKNKTCFCKIKVPNRTYKRTSLSILPRANLVAEFKEKAHQNRSHLCPAEWQKLREQLIANSKNIHLQNVDAIIVGQCNNSKDLPIAKSYIEYLRSQSIQPNYATLGKLLKTYYLGGKSQKLSETDEMEILRICKQIQDERDVLDAVTCENLIHGLLTTASWKDALNILNMTKLSSSPSIHAYSSIISKAFLSNEIDLGWKLLVEMIESGKQPTCEVFTSYIDYCSLDPPKLVENVERLFKFLGKHEILVSEAVIEKLKSKFETLGHTIKSARLNGNGKCSNCQTHMENISITNKEFDKLQSSFLERVLIRKDVFQKSSPKEVEKFMSYIDRNGPFDCVIDGLNVAYSCGAKKPPKVFVNLLSSVVKYFKRQNKHVLVLGRRHMENWPRDGMNFVKHNSCVFLTNDLTHDDPFLLYAALKSGQTTDFFSRDLMRSHAYLLGAELKSIFKRWQQEHQYSLVTVSEKGIVVKEPTRHFKFAQEVNGIWHIPYKATYSPNPTEILNVPEDWMCIKFNE